MHGAACGQVATIQRPLNAANAALWRRLDAGNGTAFVILSLLEYGTDARLTMKKTIPISVFFCFLLLATDALALRCGNRLVQEGMTDVQVIQLCGEPYAERQLGYVLRPYIVKRPAGTVGIRSTRRVYGGYHQELAVTELLFNFGPRRLMRLMRFEGGRLTYIETAGYGHREK